MLKDGGLPDLPKEMQRALRKANQDVDRRKASYEEATKRRTELILEAEAEYPRSQIAGALGITVGRVQQLVGKTQR
jgi:DNA-directed RNA polymerase specialized sigma24 family protein